MSNKNKIINDPVYGFIHIPFPLIFDLIEHPYFQRLRRIRQLGLTHLVYPGAQHTRFQHCLGALNLMNSAIQVLKIKNVKITKEEAEAVSAGILLHDIGHGPFSHALEQSLMEHIPHEELSLLFMEALNSELNGKLDMTLQIFRDEYPKKFLYQLISGQLDMDRLDYLRRDSFFTGVTEGTVGSERIIKMINVVNDKLVVEVKGIYSIEKFLISRRFMFWQVYLHKTVLSAEFLLVKILKRARELSLKGVSLFGTPALHFFLSRGIDHEAVFKSHPDYSPALILENFSQLDDNDIITSVKMWANHEDKVLSELCRRMVNRNLFRMELQGNPFQPGKIKTIKKKAAIQYEISLSDASYFVFPAELENHAYDPGDQSIQILYKDGTLREIGEASDLLSTTILSKTVKKYGLCYPKEFGLK